MNIHTTEPSMQALAQLITESTEKWASDIGVTLGTDNRVKQVHDIEKKKVQHAYIAPIPHLNLVQWSSSKFHLILAHLMRHRAYADYYKSLHEQGHYIILDNGAFENGQPYGSEQLAEIVKASFQPNVIVAPDYPGQPYWATMKAFEEFQQTWSKLYPDMSIMGVPQSQKGDWQGWMRCYDYMHHHPNCEWIGLSILGIPNAFCGQTGTADISVNRTYACAALKQAYPVFPEDKELKHHALGMGSPREIVVQKAIGFIDSNDSSSAIWHGLHGVKYDTSPSALIGGKLPIPVDFERKFVIDSYLQDVIAHNIQYMESMR